MKVLVLGAGVIGVTTAYYLAEAGHEVVVVDRQPGPALETSFANAGEISPGYASPWAGPGVPLKAVRWLVMRHGPLVFRPKLDAAMWIWIARLLRNCTARRYAVNKGRMVSLAEYSRDCLRSLRGSTGIAYEARSLGTLQLFRDERQLVEAAGDVAVLKEHGVPFELLDANGCTGAEPALSAVREKIAGGLRLPDDETGDCAMFTANLTSLAIAKGVEFAFNTNVARIVVQANGVSGVETQTGFLAADAYVVALGSYSPLALRQIGIALPVYPIKGYSITAPILDPEASPMSTVMDESFKVAITRLGDRIRIGGTAEICGYDLSLTAHRRATLEHSVSDLFPRGGDLTRASFWCGLRPMTPDGPPILGRTRFKNLYLNTGHGTLGWTMACGSGRVVADLISGREPDIDAGDLNMERTHGGA
jgi:D-amino-acid dehydrogenase